MHISDEHFAEFKKIYKEEFGEEEYNRIKEEYFKEDEVEEKS